MVQISVTIAGECVDAVRRSVSTLLQVKAESLRHAALAHVAGEWTAVAVERRGRELAEIEHLLDQLGPEARGDREVRLEAGEALLREAVYGAAIDEVEEAAELVQSCWRGERDASELREALARSSALTELLEELDGRT